MIKNSKRGTTLLEFVIDLVIGILCALIIIYLVTLIYAIFFEGKDKGLALETLSSVEKTAQSLNIDESRVMLLKVPEWYLVSFEKGVGLKKEILPPPSCADANCLCLCKPIKMLGVIDTSADCRKNAECKIFVRPFKEGGKDLYFKLPQEIKVTSIQTGDYGFFEVERK